MLIFNKEYIDGSWTSGMCVWLQPPARRVIQYSGWGQQGYKQENFLLSTPYSLFRIKYYIEEKNKKRKEFIFSELSVGFVTNKRVGKKTSVYSMPFPNIGDDGGQVCMPSVQRVNSLEELCQNTISDFWGSVFTGMEAGYHCQEYMDGEMLLGDYAKWERMTKKNPQWKPSRKSMILMSSYEAFLAMEECEDEW